MKIRPVGTECFVRTDGQTDMTKLPVAFQNFVNALKIVCILNEGVVIHKCHYARNPFFSHKNFPERCFAQHARITAPNPSVGRGVTVMNSSELNLFLVTDSEAIGSVGRLAASAVSTRVLSSCN